MRIWVDLTNSPHVLVLRPVIDLLRGEGHEVQVTARDFAQTLQLLERFEIPHSAIGAHRGERRGAKAVGLISRSLALLRWARGQSRQVGRPFDIALGHGSNDISVAAALLRIPSSTMFDYEFAALQHHINCRLASCIVVPEAIPPQRLARYGASGKLAPYAGLKEEYYLADFEPEPAILRELRLEGGRPLVVVRTPPDLALYHRFDNEIFGELLAALERMSAEAALNAVVLPRTPKQRRELQAFQRLIVPERAIDAQSLIALSQLVISAGGTMNREAAALGVPVFSTFQGRLGAVDERLIAEQRLRLLCDRTALSGLLTEIGSPGWPERLRSPGEGHRQRRDVHLLADLLLRPVGSPRAHSPLAQAADAGTAADAGAAGRRPDNA